MITMLLFLVCSQVGTESKLPKPLQAYRLDLESRSKDLQKEMLSGRLSRDQKAARSIKLRQYKAILAKLDKGQVAAESFDDVATRDREREYVPQVGEVFYLSKDDVSRQDGEDVVLRWTITILVARNNRPATEVHTLYLEARIVGGFKPGVYYVSAKGPVLRLIEGSKP